MQIRITFPGRAECVRIYSLALCLLPTAYCLLLLLLLLLLGYYYYDQEVKLYSRRNN